MKRHPPSHLEEVLPKLRAAVANEDLAFAILHGSAEEERDFADLDIGVWAAGPVVDPLRFTSDIADRLEACTGVAVDVQLLNDAPLTFAYHVSRGRVLTVRDLGALERWRETTWNEYFDFQPYLAEQTRALLRGSGSA